MSQMRALDGQVRAGGQAHEIDGVREAPDFVEIIDAPNQAAFDVAPGAEVFDVQIADGQHGGPVDAIVAESGHTCIQR